VPHMRAAGWGRICLITSSSVKQPIPDLATSNTARAGLWGWAKTAAQDLIDEGITLNLACPGLHATDRVTDLGFTGRLGDPADFGRVVAFLCSQHAGFISGAALQVDGASTLGLL
jgi:3-oxoacyl-[acyl-carrier protein] reductase